MADMGRLVWRIEANTTQFKRQMDGAFSTIRDFSSVITRLAAVGGLAAFVSRMTEAGDRLQKLAIRTGTTVEEFQTLTFAAGKAGVSVEELGRILTKQAEKLGAESGATQEALTELGTSVAALDDLSPGEAFNVLIERIAAVKDPARQAALATALWGERLGALVVQLARQQEGFAAAQKEAEGFLRLTQEEADTIARFNDAIFGLGERLKGFGGASVAFFAGFLTPIIDDLNAQLDQIGEIVKRIQGFTLQGALDDLRRRFFRPDELISPAPGVITQGGGGFDLMRGLSSFGGVNPLESPAVSGIVGGGSPFSERLLTQLVKLLGDLAGIQRQEADTLRSIEGNTRTITNLPARAG